MEGNKGQLHPEQKKWKAPKGPKPVQHKNKNLIGLGRNIANRRRQENEIQILPDGEMRFTTDKKEADWVKLRSVTQENALDEFLNTAQLADTDFTADKHNQVKIIKVGNTSIVNQTGLLSDREANELKRRHQAFENKLIIPRRPKWSKSQLKFELERQENLAFLDWRRQLAELSENNDLLLTPFERNLEVWKQLWRVVERCDLVVQIVDARNPLFFRSTDLEKYVGELSTEENPKNNLLLVNKADMLTRDMRIEWARYFEEKKINFVFFSALDANQLLELQREQKEEELRIQEMKEYDQKQDDSEEEDDEEDDVVDVSEDKDSDEESEEESEEFPEEDPEEDLEDLNESDEDEETTTVETHSKASNDHNDQSQAQPQESISPALEEKIRILKIEELEELFLSSSPRKPSDERKLQIGLVGYPNVGKSSTINALVGSKMVSVSATPGKTKHFQTINLSNQVMLCDCPGLVFPTFAYTNGELVCNGVLPIDQLREHIPPVSLVCQRIPKFYLEALYGIHISVKSIEDGGTGVPTAAELLNAYARARGYMTQGFGSADEPRASRYILKDYVNGKLLFVVPPPRVRDDNEWDLATVDEGLEFNKTVYNLNTLPENRQTQIRQAMMNKGFKEEEFDLSRDLAKLNFGQHIASDSVHFTDKKNKQGIVTGGPKTLFYGGKQARLQDDGGDLDREFFKMTDVKGKFNVPFHKQDAGSKSKKHGKKNKKSDKKTRVVGY